MTGLLVGQVPAAFTQARADACRYCGRRWVRMWVRMMASANDGHAACLVTPEFRRAVTALWWSSPALTIAALAELCGVSRGTADAWTRWRDAGGVRHGGFAPHHTPMGWVLGTPPPPAV